MIEYFFAKRITAAYWRGHDFGIDGAAKIVQAAILAADKLGPLRIEALPDLILSLRHEKQKTDAQGK